MDVARSQIKDSTEGGPARRGDRSVNLEKEPLFGLTGKLKEDEPSDICSDFVCVCV